MPNLPPEAAQTFHLLASAGTALPWAIFGPKKWEQNASAAAVLEGKHKVVCLLSSPFMLTLFFLPEPSRSKALELSRTQI